ncbi:organic cation transporter protein-like [Chironomus tepperi]|uniref:organic cation transporter protein-like n=1 Tax=Chironomus tepperi TaxID=113505 RepID=UPI00391F74BD
MDFDNILDEIGEFGKFQLKNYILVCLPVFYAAANSLSYVFTSRAPNYRCSVPQCESFGDTYYNQEWIKDVLPGSISDTTGKFIPEQCLQYGLKDNINDTLPSVNNTCLGTWFDSEVTTRCNEWIFDEHETTIVNDWPNLLTCSENQWKLALVGSSHFFGIMMGSAVFGILADSFGRKKIFIVAIIFMSLTGVAQGLSNSYMMFIIFAFLNAVGTSGVYPLAFVLGVEMVGKNKREMSGVVLNYFYSVGEALVGIIAWIDGDWRNLQFWVSIPPILFIFYYWLIPESARWLLAKHRNRKAFKIIRKAAEDNKKEISQNILDRFNENNSNDDEREKNLCDESTNVDEEGAKVYLKLIKSRVLLIRCLILFFVWGTNAFVYYGLSLNSVNLSGNIYLNFILGCLIEIPGNTIAWIIMNKIGRKYSLVASFLLCGITCMSSAFVPEKVFGIQIFLFLVGKMAITSSFAIVFVYSAEVMPTVIRSGGVGAFSTFSRLGALLAPFVPLLKFIFEFLPLLIFGLFAFAAGLLSILLPETLGRKLPDSFEEAENI